MVQRQHCEMHAGREEGASRGPLVQRQASPLSPGARVCAVRQGRARTRTCAYSSLFTFARYSPSEMYSLTPAVSIPVAGVTWPYVCANQSIDHLRSPSRKAGQPSIAFVTTTGIPLHAPADNITPRFWALCRRHAHARAGARTPLDVLLRKLIGRDVVCTDALDLATAICSRVHCVRQDRSCNLSDLRHSSTGHERMDSCGRSKTVVMGSAAPPVIPPWHGSGTQTRVSKRLERQAMLLRLGEARPPSLERMFQFISQSAMLAGTHTRDGQGPETTVGIRVQGTIVEEILPWGEWLHPSRVPPSPRPHCTLRDLLSAIYTIACKPASPPYTDTAL